MQYDTKETDAELEKFIDKAVNDCCGSQECEGAPILYYWEDVDKVAKEVAAFAAKRARERAIGEYHAKIMNWLTGRGLGRIATDLNSHLLKSL